METLHKSKRNITHVIFDVDGLILDTERLYTDASQTLCAEYGKEFTWEIKSKQMGQKEQVAAKILIDMNELPLTVDEYLQKLYTILNQLFPKSELLPGAESLIRHLHKHKIPICIATGSGRKEYAKKISLHTELFSLFHHSVFSSDDPEVKEGKPAPDCFLLAAERFDVTPQPEQALVFEDSPNGVQAGLSAGMPVIWVPDPRADKSMFGNKVDLILDSLEQFKPEDFGLPPYDSDEKL